MDAIQFSGGKDSLAVLYLMRDRLDSARVYFGDTGGVYPHMKSFVVDTCARLGADLRIVTPPCSLDAFHAAVGIPSDIVPVEASYDMKPYVKRDGPLLQSPLTCCGFMLWKPLNDAMIRDGVTTLYRGSKACDSHVGVGDGFTDANGITYRSPLWDWSDGDVFAYLKSVGAELPKHYGEVNNSFDCILCTAFLKSPGAKERIAFTKKNYPDQWPELRRRLATVKDVIGAELSAISGALSTAELEG